MTQQVKIEMMKLSRRVALLEDDNRQMTVKIAENEEFIKQLRLKQSNILEKVRKNDKFSVPIA